MQQKHRAGNIFRKAHLYIELVYLLCGFGIYITAILYSNYFFFFNHFFQIYYSIE